MKESSFGLNSVSCDDPLPDIIRELPSDLLPGILSKLPVKSLCRFKCVSRSWLSMIKDPDFIAKTRLITPPEWKIFGCKGGIHVYPINENGIAIEKHGYTLDLPEYRVRICNDVIIFLEEDWLTLSVFNLATQERTCLPQQRYPYDREKYIYQYELGFDSLSKEYKVLSWIEIKGELELFRPSHFHVLTLGNNPKWRRIKNNPNFSDMDICISVNGTLFGRDNDAGKIISFNLAKENFGLIKFPEEVDHRTLSIRTLLEFEGSLCLAEQNRKLSKERKGQVECPLGIWMLKDADNNIWSEIMSEITLPLRVTDEVIDLSIFARSGDIVVATNDNGVKFLFLTYSFLNGQFKRISFPELTFEGIWKRDNIGCIKMREESDLGRKRKSEHLLLRDEDDDDNEGEWTDTEDEDDDDSMEDESINDGGDEHDDDDDDDEIDS